MLPVFANPAGLWVLLGVPIILAIHFLQQRAQIARTSTWFLIEKLAPDSARGRTWDRLRTSRALWLQLLAVLLAAWVLGQPRWIRAESAQTVVIVLDASASMDAFRPPALAAAERDMNLADGLAARTTWVMMTTNPRQPVLYRGFSREAAIASLAGWQPELGDHDIKPALRLARTLAGGTGRTLLITDTRADVPPDQRTAGVGRPIENVGFAGGSVLRAGNGHQWRALIKNHANSAQQRSWHVESPAGRSAEQQVDLAAGSLAEISAPFPDGVDRLTIVLSDDPFAADNRLPLIRPRAKRLAVTIEGDDNVAGFFRRLTSVIDGVSAAASGTPAAFRIARLSGDEIAREARAGIFWPPPDRRQQIQLLTEPVTPERDPLVSGLNWQGWLGAGPFGYVRAPGDTVLLWHGRWPVVLVRPANVMTDGGAARISGTAPAAPARQLLLAFDWETSNASRLPAMVLLARRFIEAERDAQPDSYAANFDCAAPLALEGVPADGSFTLTFEAATSERPAETKAIPPTARTDLRVPGRAGFFTLQRNDVDLVYGAAQFADPRQGDFRAAETFFTELREERATALERNSVADPYVTAWLVLLAVITLWSWSTRQRAGHPGEKKNPPAPALIRPEVETAPR